jgi:hypothetical protein
MDSAVPVTSVGGLHCAAFAILEHVFEEYTDLLVENQHDDCRDGDGGQDAQDAVGEDGANRRIARDANGDERADAADLDHAEVNRDGEHQRDGEREEVDRQRFGEARMGDSQAFDDDVERGAADDEIGR